MTTRLLFIHAMSPIHCGTGQAIGGIDLPIAREKPTGLPLVPGSSIKGVLRAAKKISDATHLAVFGPETEFASDHAGGVQFADASLLFLPVRSVRGTFAWVTSPYVLQRFARDAREVGIDLGAIPSEPQEKEAIVTSKTLQADGRVIFEDFDFTAREDSKFAALTGRLAEWIFPQGPERDRFKLRACLVHEDVMSLLLQTCTEITARIRLKNETKTVEQGALWSEESLPVETILSGLVVATPTRQKDGSTPTANDLLEYVKKVTSQGAIQLGGKASVGRGVCHLTLAGG